MGCSPLRLDQEPTDSFQKLNFSPTLRRKESPVLLLIRHGIWLMSADSFLRNSQLELTVWVLGIYISLLQLFNTVVTAPARVKCECVFIGHLQTQSVTSTQVESAVPQREESVIVYCRGFGFFIIQEKRVPATLIGHPDVSNLCELCCWSESPCQSLFSLHHLKLFVLPSGHPILESFYHAEFP